MSATDIIANYSFEAAKTTAEPEFKFQLEDYFTPSAELDAYADAIGMLCNQVEIVEDTIAKLDAGVELSDSAAEVINSLLSRTCFAAIGSAPIIVDISTEAEKEGEKKEEKGADKSAFKEKAKVAYDNAKRMLAKLVNYVMDFVRKFRTGTKLLQGKINDALKSHATELKGDKLPAWMAIDGKLATGADISGAAKELATYFAMYVNANSEKKGGGEISILGNRTYVIEEKEGVMSASSKESTAVSGGYDLAEGDIKSLLKGCQEAARMISNIDHKKVSKESDKLLKAAAGDKVSTKQINAYTKVIRELSVSAPSAHAKAMAKVVAACAKGGKAEDKKDDKKDEE